MSRLCSNRTLLELKFRMGEGRGGCKGFQSYLTGIEIDSGDDSLEDVALVPIVPYWN